MAVVVGIKLFEFLQSRHSFEWASKISGQVIGVENEIDGFHYSLDRAARSNRKGKDMLVINHRNNVISEKKPGAACHFGCDNINRLMIVYIHPMVLVMLDVCIQNPFVIWITNSFIMNSKEFQENFQNQSFFAFLFCICLHVLLCYCTCDCDKNY